ncbi:MAG: DUF1844 domain-containing protein [bacterium]
MSDQPDTKRPESAGAAPLEPLSVDELLEIFYANLYEKALAYMGLAPHPETRTTAEDFAQAKTAIDMMDQIFARIKDRMEWKYRIEAESALTSLHLTYTKKICLK